MKALLPFYLLLPSILQVQGKYVAPSESSPLPRYALTISTHDMGLLADDLLTLATTIDATQDSNLRHGAKLVALVHLLEPANRKTQELEQRLQNKENCKDADAAARQDALSRISTLQKWLESPAAGKMSNEFAACLSDVVQSFHAKNPEPEKGSWNHWVAEAAAFEESTLEIKPEESAPEKETLPAEQKILLTTGKLKCPMYLSIKTDEQELTGYALASMQMQVLDQVESDSLKIAVTASNPAQQAALQERSNQTLKPWLKKTFPTLPAHKTISFSVNRNQYDVAANHIHVPGMFAALAASALDGAAATGVIIVNVKSDGSLAMPYHGWQDLRFMNLQEPTRIILPAISSKVLPDLIPLGDLALFLKHDVFIAKDLDELVLLSKEKPNQSIAQALADFHEIRSKANPGMLGNFLRNPYVIKRLEAIIAACPSYISPKALLLEARASAPKMLSDAATLMEIRRALQPLQWMPQNLLNVATNYSSMNFERYTKAHDEARAILDPIKSIVSANKRADYNVALMNIDYVRTFARSAKNASDQNGYYDKSTFHERTAAEMRKNIMEYLKGVEPLIQAGIESSLQTE